MRVWPIVQCRTRVSLGNERRALITIGKQASFFSTVELDRGPRQTQDDHSQFLSPVKSVDQGYVCIEEDGLQDDPFLNSLLIQSYGKRGNLCDALTLFNRMPERPMRAWKSIIRAYAQYGDCIETLQLVQQLLQEGFVPDKYTFVSVLTACAKNSDLSCGRQFHAVLVSNGFSSDIALAMALVNMYGKCDSLPTCIDIFENMNSRNVISWNIVIAVHVKHNQRETAFSLFYQMQEEGVLPNRITLINVLYVGTATCTCHKVDQKVHATFHIQEFEVDPALGNALLSMYCKSGRLLQASLLFDGLLTQNLVSWTTMIECYDQQRHSRKAFQCFKQMQQQGILPDQVSYLTVLKACSSLRALFEGKQIHAQLASIKLESTSTIGTALMQMYGACGRMEWAYKVFYSMTSLNLFSWTSLIALQSQHEDGAGTFQAFRQMMQQGFMPDKVALFSLLDTCNTKMNVHESKFIHSIFSSAGYELDDNARVTLYSLYLSSRNLKEAGRIFNTLSHMDVPLWTAMIATYTEHGQDLEALQLFCQMEQEGILSEELTYVQLLSICSNLPSLFNGRRIHTYVTQVYNNTFKAPLINMYSKGGDLCGAQTVFDEALELNSDTWSALLAAYVRHGESRKALHMFNLLAAQNQNLDDCTLLQALLACCRSGLVDEALGFYSTIAYSYSSNIGLDHFCCMIDLFSRAGLLEYAEAFLCAMPRQPSAALWMALLGACQQQVDLWCAERLAEYIAESSQSESRHYVVLSNVYAFVGTTGDEHEKRMTA